MVLQSGQQNGGPKTGLRARRLSTGDSAASPNAEAPPGFNITASSSAGGSWAPISESRGLGHGDHSQLRKGSEIVIPTAPSVTHTAGLLILAIYIALDVLLTSFCTGPEAFVLCAYGQQVAQAQGLKA